VRLKDGKRAPLKQEQMVAYPAIGGFEQVFSALARKLPNLSLSDKVLHIDTEKRILYRTAGEPLQYKNLISTMPLHHLLNVIKNVPADLTKKVMRLESLEMRLVLVAVNRPVDTPVQRIYSADPDIPFHKLAINHNSSDYLRGLPTHGLIAEVSSTQESTLNDDDLKNDVMHSLLRLGLIRKSEDVTHAVIKKLKYGYPVPTHDRSKIVGQVRDWLAERKVFLVGRFAEWDYINSDEAMHRGMVLAAGLAAL
jgi:protoporphyrinogen oxidase